MTDELDTTAEPQKRMDRRRLAVILAVAAVLAALAGYGLVRALDDDACACDPPPPAPVTP